jgi:hypothetical protein
MPVRRCWRTVRNRVRNCSPALRRTAVWITSEIYEMDNRLRDEDRPKRTPLGTVQLLARAATAGPAHRQFSQTLHERQAEAAVRRIQGILSFIKKYGVARMDEACAAALELEAYDYRFIRRYLERNSQPPLSLRQVDPLIRQLTLYRDLIEKRTGLPPAPPRMERRGFPPRRCSAKVRSVCTGEFSPKNAPA